MDQASLQSNLADLALPAVRFFPTIGSTNDEAWRWVEAGAPHGALVIAEEQTAGRGRMRRQWVTAAGCGLAFSLVLRSLPLASHLLSRLTGLGAVAVCQTLHHHYSLPAQVKWPNDILLAQRKAGGVLVELRWNGGDLTAAVIGIGVNITHQAINPQVLPLESLDFPATSVEDELGTPVDRLVLLHGILQEFFNWLPRLASPDFMHVWETSLAYRGQWVELYADNNVSSPNGGSVTVPTVIGKVIGLTGDGSLQLRTHVGEGITARIGEIRLRPAAGVPPG